MLTDLLFNRLLTTLKRLLATFDLVHSNEQRYILGNVTFLAWSHRVLCVQLTDLDSSRLSSLGLDFEQLEGWQDSSLSQTKSGG